MAKSSRSKWKKMHRRQRSQEEATNTLKRIRQLNKKLELTVKGGISAVPPQEPERRFHFLNPELDSRVPNTRKDLNNNYRAELNHVHYDYTKPLKLAPPKTNMYGKTDVSAPHPMTVNYEQIDADAPLAGHALTKADMERLTRKQVEHAKAEAAAAAAACAEEDVDGKDYGIGSDDHEDENEDGPEEYIFGMDDVAPRRASGKQKMRAKKETGLVVPKAKRSAASAPAGAAPSPKSVEDSGNRMRTVGSAAAVMADDDEATDHHRHRDDGVAANKITSMQTIRKKNGTIVSTSGSSKMKKVGKQSGSSGGTRVVSSGSTAAQKGMSNVAKSHRK
ncbi:hypothetical protein JKF63_07242 [Porcisia hertigi]|uniref:Uncharacterized protein n=1 Tax=Porcisia hertigi TaxID=2761500 RepID=A0A836LL81_9TRYP|nr:hypothetical protein JKF63_07242 [Porcisia hertigi]